jgi:hypothetical protein
MNTELQARSLKSIVAFLAIEILSCPASWAASDNATLQLDEVNISSPDADYASAIAAAQAGDLATADRLMSNLINSSDFGSQDVQKQWTQLLMSAQVAGTLNDFARALVLASRASELPVDDPSPWALRLGIAFKLHDGTEAARSLTALVQRWPQALKQNGKNQLGNAFSMAILQANSDAAYELLQALQKANWDPLPPASRDSFRYHLARLALDRDNADLAATMTRDIVELGTLIYMRIDQRFSAIVATNPRQFDIERAAASAVVEARAKVASNPSSLEDFQALSEALRTNRQCKDSLTVLNKALQRWRSGDVNAAFSDASAINWIMDARSSALGCLGRWNEAAEQMLEATRQTEHGKTNVSQVLNLAELYADLERPSDALQLLELLKDTTTSIYGGAVAEGVRHTVAVQTQNSVEMRRSMEYLAAHQADAPRIYSHALFEENRYDEVANAIVHNLADPKNRAQALAELQEFSVMPQTRLTASQADRYKALQSRSDIKAAVTQYGRIERFNIYRPPGL